MTKNCECGCGTIVGNRFVRGHKNKGVKFSDKWKKNISKFHADISGTKNPMYGKKHSNATKEKIRQKRLMLQRCFFRLLCCL